MAEEKHHSHLFGRHHEEEENISDDEAFTGGGDGFAGGDYSSENIGGGHSRTIEESVEDYEKEKKEKKEHKHKEQLGEIDALADDDFDLYEKEEAKKDLEQVHKHNIEEKVPATVGVGPACCGCHEQHEKKEAKEDD